MIGSESAVTVSVLVRLMFEPTVALSVLSLDLDPPTTGWPAYLAGRGVPIVEDDLGRPAIARADARLLFEERREAEVRAREAVARNDAQVEAARVASVVPGVPWWEIPEGVSPAQAMAAADKMTRPRRRTVLEDALAGDGTTFHPIRSE
jgi:hypothetical protein